MKRKSTYACLIPGFAAALAVTTLMLIPSDLFAVWTSADKTVEVQGFVDNSTYYRFGAQDGLSKMRNRGQLEFSKMFQTTGIFSELSLHGTLRGSYDAAYDLNDDEWGDQSGGSVLLESLGGPDIGLPTSLPWCSI